MRVDLGLSEADFSRLSLFGLSLLMERKRNQIPAESGETSLPELKPETIAAIYEKRFG